MSPPCPCSEVGRSSFVYPAKGKGRGRGKTGFKGGKGKERPGVFGLASGGPGKGKGQGKGSQTPGSPSFTGCFICGDKQHDYGYCPKRGQIVPRPGIEPGTFRSSV